MRTFLAGLMVIELAAANASAAEELNVGDKAPALSVSKWIKGEKIDSFAPGKLYVVEFWATWCGPCRTSIPHLSELQKKYKDIAFVGVSIWEDDPDLIAPFVQNMGDKMEYRVAADDVPDGKSPNEGKTAKAWMDAAGEQGIPTAFVVNKDGKVAWIGHPMSIGEPLEKIVAGAWDVAKAANERKLVKAFEKRRTALMSKLSRAETAAQAAKFLPEIDALLADDEESAQTFMGIKFQILLATDEDKAASFAEEIGSKKFSEESSMLNQLAWSLIDPEKRPKPSKKAAATALKLAKKAGELTEHNNAYILDTLALAHFRNGDKAKALELQEKAMKLATDEERQELKGRLELYRQADQDKK